MELRFRSTHEAQPGAKWRALFDRTWPAYQAWFLREGEDRRPSYLRCATMLEKHMPELVPMWQRLTELAGGGDHVARLLSLYRPTPYLAGCSQAIAPAGGYLVRNYDYHPDLFEGTLLCSDWHGTKVIAMSDCLWGVLDGLNEHGLAVSLAFGGRTVVGDGFGVPLVLRYILELSRTTKEATRVLERVPSHMAYNVSILDAAGDHATVEVAPDRPARVTREGVATNHQHDGIWEAHAKRTQTEERKRLLEERLASDPAPSREALIAGFLEPPLYAAEWAHALGTLYTAAYAPREQSVELRWPGASYRATFDRFEETELLIPFADATAVPPPPPTTVTGF